MIVGDEVARASARDAERRMSPEMSAVLDSLSGPRWTILEAPNKLPKSLGLYAAHADESVWEELGMGAPPDSRPLYVGKAEKSVVSRDVATHFGDGRTGSSTLRRSFAALLRERLALRGMPRNPEKPGYFANYGLSEADDRKVTEWMTRHLLLASWGAPMDTILLPIEIAVIGVWKPPLNLKDVVTSWTARVKAARKVMADQAREWSPTRQPAE
jgi:hypothetical protein